jgi:endonuclease I
MNKLILTLFTFFITISTFSQGTETFTNIPAASSSYSTRTWTGDNGLLWTATDARTDQTINGPAIGLRFGTISVSNVPNGIGNLSFNYKYIFTGSQANIEVRINGAVVRSIAVPSTATTVQTATINDINIAGTFSLEIAQTVSGGPRVAIDDVTWTGFSGSACVTPSAQPTNLAFSSITNNSINVSFTAASPAPNGYLALISTSNTLTATPQNGTTYTEGDVIGNGTVVSSSSNLSFSLTSLSPGTTYYVYVFAVNSACTGGPLYNTTSPLTGNATTTTPPACASPSTSPGNLTSNAAGTSVSGTFNAATGADGYLAIRSTNAAFSFTPVNGTTYSVGQSVGSGGTVIKFGEGTTFSSTGLSASTTYYFFVYAVSNFNCTGGPLYNSTASTGSATTTNNVTGEPSGYYSNTTGRNCADLKTTLKTIITTGNTPRSYGDLWGQYLVSDIKPREVGPGTSSTVIWDVYSDNPSGPDPYNFTPGTGTGGQQDNGTGGSTEGERYNREHSVPLSWFNGSTSTAGPATDYHHIFPTDKFVNALRSNYIYGEVATATTTTLNGSKLGSSAIAGFSGPVFEPINEYKGDLARAFLYFVTRYEDNMPGWPGGTNGMQAFDPTMYPSVDIPYLQLMIKWHNQDPVSQKEIDRNNAGYTFQGNRNPYVDRPEYVGMVWNSTCTGLSTLPVEIIYFAGKLSGDKIRLEWKAVNENHLDRFEVERSTNGTSYNKIGEVKAANLTNYTFEHNADKFAGQRVFYRLKRVDKDGNSKYTQVFTIHLPANTKFNVYPNPASSFIHLQLNKNVIGNVTVQIVDVMGKTLQQQQFSVNGNTLRLGTESLSAGTYLVKLIYNGEQYIQKVMVAK